MRNNIDGALRARRSSSSYVMTARIHCDVIIR
jgi:hypothetical protein